MEFLCDLNRSPDQFLSVDKAEIACAYMMYKRYRVHPDDGFVHDGGRQISLRGPEYERMSRDLQAIDIEPLLERLSVSGVEALPFQYSREQLLGLLHIFPAVVLHKVSSVILRYQTADELNQSQSCPLWDGGSETLAQYENSGTGGKVTIFLDSIVDDYEEVYNSAGQDQASSAAFRMFFESLAHEMGHALHDTLPLAVLARWHHGILHEDVDVTEYVREVRKASPRMPEAYQEDFACSLGLFITSPEELAACAPHRYAAMYELITTTMSPVQDTTQASLVVKPRVSDISVN